MEESSLAVTDFGSLPFDSVDEIFVRCEPLSRFALALVSRSLFTRYSERVLPDTNIKKAELLTLALTSGAIPFAEWLLSTFPTKEVAEKLKDMSTFGDEAARFGQVASLDWLKFKGFNIGVGIFEYGAQSGHIPVMEWTLRNDIPFTKISAGLAGLSGSLAAVKWVLERGGELNDFTYADSAGSGSVEILSFLVEKFGLPHDFEEAERCTRNAIRSGSLSLVEFLWNAGFPFPGRCDVWSVDSGSLPILQFILACPGSRGLVWPSSHYFSSAVSSLKMELVDFLLEKGAIGKDLPIKTLKTGSPISFLFALMAKGFQPAPDLLNSLISYISLSEFEQLINAGVPISDLALLGAIQNRRPTELLRRLYVLTGDLGGHAAIESSMSIGFNDYIDLVISNGTLTPDDAFLKAVKAYSLPTCRWLMSKHGAKPSTNHLFEFVQTLNNAAKQLPVDKESQRLYAVIGDWTRTSNLRLIDGFLRLFQEAGLEITGDYFIRAALFGNFVIMSWLLEHNLAGNGLIRILDPMKMSGDGAARRKQEELLMWAIAVGHDGFPVQLQNTVANLLRAHFSPIPPPDIEDEEDFEYEDEWLDDEDEILEPSTQRAIERENRNPGFVPTWAEDEKWRRLGQPNPARLSNRGGIARGGGMVGRGIPGPTMAHLPRGDPVRRPRGGMQGDPRGRGDPRVLRGAAWTRPPRGTMPQQAVSSFKR